MTKRQVRAVVADAPCCCSELYCQRSNLLLWIPACRRTGYGPDVIRKLLRAQGMMWDIGAARGSYTPPCSVKRKNLEILRLPQSSCRCRFTLLATHTKSVLAVARTVLHVEISSTLAEDSHSGFRSTRPFFLRGRVQTVCVQLVQTQQLSSLLRSPGGRRSTYKPHSKCQCRLTSCVRV